jgi:hypothetical protein
MAIRFDQQRNFPNNTIVDVVYCHDTCERAKDNVIEAASSNGFDWNYYDDEDSIFIPEAKVLVVFTGFNGYYKEALQVELTEYLVALRGKHFEDSVPEEVKQKLFDFITFTKNNFISEFKDSQASVTIGNVEGKPYEGFIPINGSGGFYVREEYRNDQDPCSHFTKEQTKWKDKQAAQSLVGFCKTYMIDTDTALSEDFEEELGVWELDLHEPALLELRCSVTKGKILVDVAVDFKRGDVFDWDLLYEKEFTVEEFMELEFEGFFEGLIEVVNNLE